MKADGQVFMALVQITFLETHRLQKVAHGNVLYFAKLEDCVPVKTYVSTCTRFRRNFIYVQHFINVDFGFLEGLQRDRSQVFRNKIRVGLIVSHGEFALVVSA